MKYKFIAVDIQNEFASEGGKFYTPKPSMVFIQKTLFPYFQENNIKVNEIISDYRQPRPGDSGDGCHPGTWGYQSLIPDELRKSLWIKSMNSPIWTRDGIGNKNQIPGKPFPNSNAFGEWIVQNIGEPNKAYPVIFGLTIDCCVLSTIQEFRWRGYYPIVIREAVDHASGNEEDKNIVLEKTAISWWATVLNWEEFRKLENLAPNTHI